MIRVLLIDDQPIVAKAIEEMLKPAEVVFHYCQNPLQAMAAIRQFKPTVILQDLMMPEIDGLTLVTELREDAEVNKIPLVVLSSEENPQVKAKAFAKGANDYLVKLPDPIEFLARIRYHSESYKRLLERNAAHAALQKELDDAVLYVRELLPEKIDTPLLKVDWEFIPSASLGGDAFGYQWLDNDHFCFYLLDVCGHGVSAALLSISLLNAIQNKAFGMDISPFVPSSVLAALNKSYPMERHHNLFFTLWYGVIDLGKRTLTFSSGGHPPALLLTPEGKITELSSEGIAIGVKENGVFKDNVVSLPLGSKLLVFSDGIYEIPKQEKEWLSYEEFKRLALTVKGDMRALLNETALFRKGSPPLDDISLIRIEILIERSETGVSHSKR